MTALQYLRSDPHKDDRSTCVIDHEPRNMTDRMRSDTTAMTCSQEECRSRFTGRDYCVPCVATTEGAHTWLDVRAPHQCSAARNNGLCLLLVYIVVTVGRMGFW